VQPDAHKEVLIVGAGPAGLTLAAALAPTIEATVISARPSTKVLHSRATGIQPRLVTILESLGVLDRVLESAINLTGNTIYVDGEQRYSVSFYDPVTKAHGLSLDQRLLERFIEEQLPSLGRSVNWTTRLRGIVRSHDSLIAEVEDGRSIYQWECDYVIGCDGARSTVREAAGIPLLGITYDEVNFVLDGAIHGDLDPTSMHYFVAADSRLVLVPIGGKNVFKISGALPKTAGAPSSISVAKLVAQHSRGRFWLEPLTAVSQYFMHAKIADTFSMEERVFLCGDAAHLFPPNGGQGMNVAIEDAYCLAALFNTLTAQRGEIAQGACAEGNPLSGFNARRAQALERLEHAQATKANYSYEALTTTFDQAVEQSNLEAKEL
jgi:2-polyprenyl-6-methoxyphenol hydroxylase-like FAD-dependent oxidoreductase